MKPAHTSALILMAAATAVVLCVPGTAHANGADGDTAALTKKCVKCHGADGLGDEKNPAIAGIPEDQFIADLKAYRAGERKHKMMNLVTKKLTDEAIEELAEHYAAMSKK